MNTVATPTLSLDTYSASSRAIESLDPALEEGTGAVMTQQLELGAPAIEASFQPAWSQTSAPRDKLLNSASAGLVIHRVGQLKYGFRKEGIEFSLDVVRL